MSRFLSRSKSTRELRSRFVQGSDEDFLDFPRFTSTIIQADPQIHLPAKLRRRRAAVIVKELGVGANASSIQSSEMDSFMRLRRQQSLDSVRRPETLASTSDKTQQNATILTSEKIEKNPTPTGIKGIYSTRASSRTDHSSPVDSPAIGLAIGNPAGYVNCKLGNVDDPSTFVSNSESPAFFLPPKPFFANGDGKKMGTTTTITASGGEYQGVRGWRKVFGKSLFGSKKLKIQASQPALQSQAIPKPIKSSHCSRSSNEIRPLKVHVQVVAENQRNLEMSLQNTLSHPIPSTRPMDLVPKPTNDSSSSLLNVNIPNVEMERYSVMFQSVLQKECSRKLEEQPKTATLLERRNSSQKNPAKEVPRLHLQLLKRSATIGHTSRSVSPNSFDCSHEETADFSKPGIAYSRSPRMSRSHTVGGTTQKFIAPPGHGFIMAGESIPTPTFRLEKDPFETSEIKSETPQELAVRRNSDSSKLTQQSPSTETPAGSFYEGDDSSLQKNVKETVENKAVASEASPLPRLTEAENGIEGGDLSLWELLEQDPNAPIPPIPDIKTEQDAVVAAQISIARQISVSRRQLRDFTLGPKIGPQFNQPDGTVHGDGRLMRRAQSVKVGTPRIVHVAGKVKGHRVTGSLSVEYGDMENSISEFKGLKTLVSKQENLQGER